LFSTDRHHPATAKTAARRRFPVTSGHSRPRDSDGCVRNHKQRGQAMRPAPSWLAIYVVYALSLWLHGFMAIQPRKWGMRFIRSPAVYQARTLADARAPLYHASSGPGMTWKRLSRFCACQRRRKVSFFALPRCGDDVKDSRAQRNESIRQRSCRLSSTPCQSTHCFFKAFLSRAGLAKAGYSCLGHPWALSFVKPGAAATMTRNGGINASQASDKRPLTNSSGCQERRLLSTTGRTA